jgi:hypothetical protein
VTISDVLRSSPKSNTLTIANIKLMTLYEFNQLDLNNQMETVNQKGIYLDNHITKTEKFNLYAINMFFVEVCYNSIENRISDIKSFKGGILLDRYSNIETYFK